MGLYVELHDSIKKRYKLICLFDDVTQENFEETRDKINSAFEEILPNKSSFEI